MQHDTITAITAKTGFAEGLYGEDETDPKAMGDKQQKIDYLEKIIKVVGAQLNTMIEARPQKIVAGLEPENTNRLLQLLAVAAKHNPDSARAVENTRAQMGLGAPPEPKKPEPAPEPFKAPEPEPQPEPQPEPERYAFA